MAKERLKPISLHQEMQRSYLEYAMSVIVGRALPDARDGLKPVQRRILFAMHELGLTPDRPYRKCARVVGDVLGKYHPHGDQAVYDALVRQVQIFSSRYPILDGHGNFGSIDDDPPAAMRYTETRLAPISNDAILSEIDQETVDFSPNFDGSQQEPDVLPAQLPFLLLNGSAGIAVGMATSIPPHNLNEVVEALIAIVKNPSLSEERLLEIIPGPDFPTGGEILISNGIKETYTKGRGSITMRGIAHIEEIIPGKGKHKRSGIIITELPYQLNKANWIEKLADLVNNGKVSGIADIRDESDRDGMRILVEIKRDSDPEKILDFLYQKTSLQSNFGAILLALVNGQPVQLTLRKLLDNFLEFRENTILLRSNYLLKKIKSRQEIVEALIQAINNLREIINLIEKSKDIAEAKNNLINSLKINERQADGILGMPLKKITSLEKTSLKNEIKDLKLKRDDLESIINNREQLMKLMIKELRELKKRFGSSRKTKLIEGGDALIAERIANQRPNKELQRINALKELSIDSEIIIQSNNEIKIVPSITIKKLKLKESNQEKYFLPPKLIWPIKNEPKILAISELGKIGILKWEFAGQNPGPLEKFLPAGLENDKIINFIPLPNKKGMSLGLISSDGKFKRIAISEITDISNRSTTILKLKDKIKLKSCLIFEENSYLLVISNIGRIIKLKITENEFPCMGKLAKGSNIIKLFPGESIVDVFTVEDKQIKNLILITNKNSFIKHNIQEIEISKKGELGTIGINFKDTKKTKDRVINCFIDNEYIYIKTNKDRYEKLDTKQINSHPYKKEKKLNLSLKENEFIKSILSMILPENN
ncbi:DNA topoisomerase (ATP-hydrolyzing) subunit A [Prochlorococcus marinus]|uniref:DNA topoisomerase (ATP-hydrolyzing) n=1 Tax=Prochlorococcus marinus XMU1408 TaxID=2213228 RepID=A0A318R3G4_PROMR|nr:DNA topoisomerase (ATP-hydrolyzing) [Prochlorococcus marinus]MBW3042984.1 topoisomerase IV [Prochlorococcus marinus str. XMU1408]PYE03614.1 topoisomerase IV [Prochlorococcus marinus XMU1408]